MRLAKTRQQKSTDWRLPDTDAFADPGLPDAPRKPLADFRHPLCQGEAAIARIEKLTASFITLTPEKLRRLG